MNDDLISREAATQTVLEFIVEYLGGAFDEDFQKKLMERMNVLPPAQPEIIRCKDCKYGDTFNDFIEPPEIPMKCLGQHYGGTYPDDYCSYAERRTDETD